MIRLLKMGMMGQIVQQALLTGYLNIEAEDQLRDLLRQRCNTEDLNIFMQLQYETMEGRVKQESREVLKAHGQTWETSKSMALLSSS